MTRKKQGAPQKLDNSGDGNCKLELGLDFKENLLQSADCEIETSCTPEQNGMNRSDTQKYIACEAKTMDASCQKLMDFTKNFLSEGRGKDSNEAKDYLEDALVSWKLPAKRNQNRHQGSPSSIPSPSKATYDSKYSQSIDSEVESDHRSYVAATPNKEGSPHPSTNSTSPVNLYPNLDEHQLSDLASLTSAQKLLMDAMLRQKQFYDQCSNNWVNVQRSDNNCLSKSKAERYRWCVNGGEKQPTTSSHSHVSNLKRSATMAGMGTSPVQEKLYSTVFTGASKFHCRDCGDPFNTLVDLTVHMNKTGHFRDTNTVNKLEDKPAETKAKRRSTAEQEENQDEKVLTCMGCGNLFESLQDLSVHMIKTKHYENVPSLRLWSQKNEPVLEASSQQKKKHPSPPIHNDFNNYASASLRDASMLAQSPFYFSLLGAMSANPAAAACANLLCSYPWLASSLSPNFLPSILNPNMSLPYPGSYPPLLPPHLPTVNGLSSPSETDLALTCTECNAKFSSMKRLTEHRFSASHFPTLPDLKLPSGHHNPIIPMSLSQPSCSPSLSDTGKTHRPNNRSSTRSSSNEASSLSPSPNSKSDSYVKTPSVSDTTHEHIGSCDFIKSLESTIQSAISKVEHPRSKSSTLDSTRRSFNPFSAMKEQEKMKPKPANSAHGRQSKSPTTKTITASDKRQPESPLDLTVKKTDYANSRHHQQKTSAHSPTPPISAYSGTHPGKDPLQSLKDNMQSLFSGMKPGQLTSTDAAEKTKKSEYAPLHIGSTPSETNPIQEMLKIVNRPELEHRFPFAQRDTHEHRVEEGKKRSSSSVVAPINPKKSCFSLFEDLIVPKDVDSSPDVNPLQKMQDLVDRKVSGGKVGEKPKPFLPEATNGKNINSPPSNKASNIDLKRQHNGVRGHGRSSDERRHTKEAVRNFEPSKEQLLKLNVCFARFVTSLLPHQMTSSKLKLPDPENTAECCNVPLDYAKSWMAGSIDAVRMRKSLPTLSYNNSNNLSKPEFTCTWCRTYTTTTVEDFCDHSNAHITEGSGPITSRGNRASVDYVTSVPSPAHRACDVTEAERASPEAQLPQRTPPSGRESPNDVTITHDNAALRQRRRADEMTSPDDAIRVTG
ncbi:zinc finger protein 130 [Ciona intestinalis]